MLIYKLIGRLNTDRVHEYNQGFVLSIVSTGEATVGGNIRFTIMIYWLFVANLFNLWVS